MLDYLKFVREDIKSLYIFFDVAIYTILCFKKKDFFYIGKFMKNIWVVMHFIYRIYTPMFLDQPAKSTYSGNI